MRWKSWVAPAVGLCLAGCIVETTGPTQYDSKSVEVADAEAVRVNLEMKAGRLRVNSGTDKLVRADFMYNVARWKPEVRHSSTAGRASVSITQPSGHGTVGNNRYEWDVKLNRHVPATVSVRFGAGDAELDLSAVPLRGVDIEMGVGKLDLDLRGKPQASYTVRIHGGIGEAVVRLPREAGVVAEARGGIGEIRSSGLHRSDGRYYNDAYQNSKVTIRLDIQGGIGAIRLVGD
jgi:hypothetical protein